MPFHVLCALNYVKQYFICVECVKVALDSTMNVLTIVADIGCIELSFPAAQMRRPHLIVHWIRL